MKLVVRVLSVLALAGLLAVVVAGVQREPGSAVAATSGQPLTTGDAFEPELGLPASGVVAFGASPGEAHGEVWAYGATGEQASVGGQSISDQFVLLERSNVSGANVSPWQIVPLPTLEGKPLAPLSGSESPGEWGAFAGQSTARGGVVLLSGQNIVVRDPHGQPQLASAPGQSTTGGVLAPGETLLPSSPSGVTTLPYAAIDEAGEHTGVLIAPHDDGGNPRTTPGVLHYDDNGGTWTREPVEGLSHEQEESFTALSLSCGDPLVSTAGSAQDCWLLASVQASTANGLVTSLLLYQRTLAAGAAGYAWKPVRLSDWLLGGGEAEKPAGVSQVSVSPLPQGAQMLTATTQGVWVDFQATVNNATSARDFSEYLTPAPGSPPLEATTRDTWCYPTGPGCEHSLGAALSVPYRSFAWPGTTELGTRIVTGLPHRTMLELSGSNFADVAGAGGERGQAPGGAAFESREGLALEGVIAEGGSSGSAADGAGQAGVFDVTSHPQGSELQSESVPFRRPLYAVAQAPETTPGDPGSQAIAVGEQGEVAHFTPGFGWRPEALLNAAGEALTPTLRGVAWPEPGRAYAVGDEGAMWLWQAATGLWEPDPAKPLNFIGNLAAIAFSSTRPNLGYAVGRQGALLRFGKTWEQVPLPPELQQANFTSVTFAGDEALATFRVLEPVPGAPPQDQMEAGGVAVEEDGSGLHWHVDPGVSALLERLKPQDTVLSKVAGLPDGGVVAAGPSKVIERDSPSASWRFSRLPLPEGETENISALAAYRDPTGSVRAIASVDLDGHLNPQNYFNGLEQSPFNIDVPRPGGAGQPPPYLGPDLLPNSGYLLEETAGGWVDMEHEALPAPESGGTSALDMPVRPDPVLALLVDPSGSSGIAVGGQTGDIEGRGLNPAVRSLNIHYQTAAALRFPAGAASPNGTSAAPIVAPPGQASFVVAGQAACAKACADFANEGLGPEVWLAHALQAANKIATGSAEGPRAFLYTGSHGGEDVFARDLSRYSEKLLAYGPESGATAPEVSHGPGAAYAFSSPGRGVDVRVIVLDYSAAGAEQWRWLEGELAEARKSPMPAIVVGSEALGNTLPDGRGSTVNQNVSVSPAAGVVSAILVQDGASAYFFDYPGVNMQTIVSFGSRSIPAYGTGTLGYVTPPNEGFESDALGSSGFLLAAINPVPRSPAPGASDVAPYEVTARVIPNISQLALDATDGVLLRRSQVALFDALARRPPAGVAMEEGGFGYESAGPDPYDPIPFNCLGANCAYSVPSDYTFSSSEPDKGAFVAHDPTSVNPRQVELNSKQLPVVDEPRNAKGELNPGGRFDENNKGEPINEKGEVVPSDQSGLFCAFNAGTTTVSITTGGLTYAEPVTVQAGSVEYPCGTVPLKNPPPIEIPFKQNLNFPEPSPAGSPPAANPLIQTLLAPPPPSQSPPPAPVHPKPHHPRPAAVFPFLPAVAGLTQLTPAILPPPPATARPSPPTGTSAAQVYQSAVAPQRQREEEEATDVVHNMAAYGHNTVRPAPYYLPAVILLLAFAGAGLYDAGRRRRPGLATNDDTRTPRIGDR